MLCRSAAQWVLPMILQSKPPIVLWHSVREWLPYDGQELELGFNLDFCRLTNEFYLLWTLWTKCVWLELFWKFKLKSVEHAEFEDSCELIPTLIPQTVWQRPYIGSHFPCCPWDWIKYLTNVKLTAGRAVCKSMMQLGSALGTNRQCLIASLWRD